MGRKRGLNEEQVLEVRNSQESLKELARRYGVTIQTIISVRKLRGAYAGPRERASVQPDSPEGESFSIPSTGVNETAVRTSSNEQLLQELFK